MLTISGEFIQGVALGIEFVDHADIDDREGWYIVIDLLILRILLDWEKL